MATSKNQIVFKQTGQNVKLVIDGDTLSRKITDAEERKLIKERVVAYNAKPLVKEKKAIIKLFETPKKEAQKNKLAIVKKPSKIVKKVVEETPELSKEEQIEAAKKLLQENNFTVEVKKEAPKMYRRGGEY